MVRGIRVSKWSIFKIKVNYYFTSLMTLLFHFVRIIAYITMVICFAHVIYHLFFEYDLYKLIVFTLATLFFMYVNISHGGK